MEDRRGRPGREGKEEENDMSATCAAIVILPEIVCAFSSGSVG